MIIHYKWRFLLLKNINYPGLAESMIWLNFPMWNPQILGFRIEPKSHAAAPAPGQETVLCENQSLQVRNGSGNPAKPDESMGFHGDFMKSNGIYLSFSDVMVIFDWNASRQKQQLYQQNNGRFQMIWATRTRWFEKCRILQKMGDIIILCLWNHNSMTLKSPSISIKSPKIAI